MALDHITVAVSVSRHREEGQVVCTSLGDWGMGQKARTETFRDDKWWLSKVCTWSMRMHAWAYNIRCVGIMFSCFRHMCPALPLTVHRKMGHPFLQWIRDLSLSYLSIPFLSLQGAKEWHGENQTYKIDLCFTVSVSQIHALNSQKYSYKVMPSSATQVLASFCCNKHVHTLHRSFAKVQ